MIVEAGDFVLDSWDDTWRQVERVDGSTLFMEDGGVMDINEVSEIKLESEVR